MIDIKDGRYGYEVKKFKNITLECSLPVLEQGMLLPTWLIDLLCHMEQPLKSAHVPTTNL